MALFRARSFSRSRRRGGAVVKRARQGERFAIDEGRAQVEILRIEGNLMRMGPAVKVGITAGDKALSFWVFKFIDAIEEQNPGITKQIPQFNAGLYKPYSFALEGIETSFYTGLKVTRDPGVPVVGAGAFLLVAGFLLTFFSSHRAGLCPPGPEERQDACLRRRALQPGPREA